MTKARDLADGANAFDVVSVTELEYLNGVSSAIQTQIDGKQAVVSGVDSTEIGYLNGVTSAIQTQIDSKIGSASAINPTIVDAKGDIIAATAADTVARLAVGSNDQVLTADSSTATGLKWAAPASGGGMTLITETVASANTAIDFTSISGSYKQLLLVWQGLKYSSSGTVFSIKFNATTTSLYSTQSVGQVGSSTGFTVNNQLDTYIYVRDGFFGQETTGSTANLTAKGSLLIDNYSSTSKHKFFQGQLAAFYSGGSTEINHFVGTFTDTTAITQINIFRAAGSGTIDNIANTSIRLYGIS